MKKTRRPQRTLGISPPSLCTRGRERGMVGRRKQVEINRIIVGRVCERMARGADSYGIKASHATPVERKCWRSAVSCQGVAKGPFPLALPVVRAKVFIDFRRCPPTFANLDGKIIIGGLLIILFSFRIFFKIGQNEYVSDFSREIEFLLLRRIFR